MRSTVERTFFRLLRQLPAEQLRQLEAEAEPAHYQAAATARMFGWTPLAHVVGLRESLRRLVDDDERFVQLTKELALQSVEQPPFNTLTDGILRIYEPAPLPLLRAYSRVWNAIYRDVGTYRVKPTGDQGCRVRVTDVCPAAKAPAFRLYKLGILSAVAEIGGASDVEASQTLSDNVLEFHLRWAA